MKPTEDILKGIDIDQYINWIKDIYKGVDQIKYFDQKYIDELSYQEYKIKTYYLFKWANQQKQGIISDQELEKKQKCLNTAILTREKKTGLIEFKKQCEKYYEYLIDFIPFEKWKNIDYSPYKINEFAELIYIDQLQIDFLIKHFHSLSIQIENEINENKDVNINYHKIRIEKCLNTDYQILDYIVNKRFYPIFGQSNKEENKTPDILIIYELSELKTIQLFLREGSNIKDKGLNLPQQIMLLAELGYFELETLNNFSLEKQYFITSVLLNANTDNVKKNFRSLQNHTKTKGKNPTKYEGVLNQILNKYEVK